MNNLDASKFNNFDEIDKFIVFVFFKDRFVLKDTTTKAYSRGNIHHNPICVKEIEFAVNYLPVKKMADQMASLGNSAKLLRKKK